jgi:hypothetical protein
MTMKRITRGLMDAASSSSGSKAAKRLAMKRLAA